MSIRIYNPDELPFGLLSNNFNYKMFIDGEEWDNISQYIYHIPHTDEARLENLAGYDFIKKNKIDKWSLALKNDKILKSKLDWIPAEYKILEESLHYTKVKRI